MPSQSDDPAAPEPASHASRFRGRDGVTTHERDLPPSDNAANQRLEEAAPRQRPDQLDLFNVADDGRFVSTVGGMPPVTASSSLELARTAWRKHLVAQKHPSNTIESYCYDLHVFENLIGPRPLNRIERTDVALYLGDATSKSTRKRRLTSLRRFFSFLIEDARILKFDPTEGYYPHAINLRVPVPLFANEQAALLAAAEADEAWSAPAIWLMMRLGLTRSELLALRRDHIDRTNPDAPVVYVVYEALARQSKDRKLAANSEFSRLYDRYLDVRNPADILFPVGPQAVNGMVERIRKATRITKSVTPQTLRTTFAIEMARSGADQQDLLALLGLVNDPRNRASVDRYILLAAEPLATGVSDPQK
jgi:integrase/recombinase XerD